MLIVSLGFSSLLALGAVHYHLLKTKQRPRISIVVETAEAM